MLLLTLLSVLVGSLDGQTLKDRLPFYHSSSELHDDLQKLVTDCKSGHATVETRESGGVGLDVVTIKGASSDSSPKQKAMFVFGEHAREVVTTESAVHFARSICGLGSIPPDQAKAALAKTDFILVPNANPMGRQEVENGAFCKRTNENGVDLNRNWGDDHRDTNTMALVDAGDVDDSLGDEENPGAKGFSEPETQVLHSLAEEISPHLFVSVHSGTFMLGMPFGFSDSEQPANAGEMMSMLSNVNGQYCGGCCPTGSLASIGYNSKGCSIDFVAEHLKVPLAFTLEIYADSKDSSLVSKIVARKAEDVTQAFSHASSKKTASNSSDFVSIANDFFKSETSSMLQTSQSTDGNGDAACLAQFNPQDEATLNEILDAWSPAYLSMADSASGVRQSVMSNGAVAKYCQRNKEMRTKFSESVQVVHTMPHLSISKSPEQDAMDNALKAPQHAAESMDEYFSHARSRAKDMESKLATRVSDEEAQKDAEKQAEAEQEAEESIPGVVRWDALKQDDNWGFLKKKADVAVPDVDKVDDASL
jgi:hypothetical protein